MCLLQGVVKPTENGKVKIDVAQPDGAFKTLTLPCHLHKLASEGATVQATQAMQHLLSAAEESAFGYGSSQTVFE